MRYVANVSFGKDSLAMLLMLIEKAIHWMRLYFTTPVKSFKPSTICGIESNRC